MNIIEAINSGKRIRRVGTELFFTPNNETIFSVGSMRLEWETEKDVQRINMFQVFELPNMLLPLHEFDKRIDAERFCCAHEGKESLAIIEVWRRHLD